MIQNSMESQRVNASQELLSEGAKNISRKRYKNSPTVIQIMKAIISIIKAKLKKNFFIVQLYWYMG